MPDIIIHKGAHTIGGNSVEIRSNQHRILIDLGTPLMAKGGGALDEKNLARPSVKNGILPDVKGLYKNDTPSVSAILISHAHMDHYGLLDHVHPNIPVYVSEGSQALINIGKVFYPNQSKIFFDTFKIFKHWKPFQVGPFKITSYLMDHSGYDASAFLIEINGKKIFYSGDFRGHGRKAKLLDNLINNPIPNIDCLLLEGTTLGGEHHIGFDSEAEVEQEFFNIFSNQKNLSIVIASGSNVDRLVSLYKATINSKKTLVLDLYTYYLLYQLKKITPGLPPFERDNIRILYLSGHAQNIVDHLDKNILYKFKHRKIETDEIIGRREEMVLKLPINGVRKIMLEITEKKPFKAGNFIFSMWSGYLEKDSSWLNFCNENKMDLVKIHVSGHAYLKDLKRLTGALKPKKLIPIHTLSRESFDSHFENVALYDESVPFEV